MVQLKRTGLYEAHKKAGGKLVPFAGWELPIQYTSIRDEHNAVRNAAGIFDVSHMGEIIFSGPDAEKNVQNLVTNEVSKMKINRVVYSGLLYPEGTFVDDLLVYRLAEDKFLLCVNAANLDKDYQWCLDNIHGDLECVNASDQYTQIAIQGPKSMEILQPLTETTLGKIRYYRFRMGEVGGVPAIISRTGYTGELGFELYFDPSESIKIWDMLMEQGEKYGLKPAGLGCRDTLRLEAGMALYGNDIDNEHTPLEAGLDWTVKMDKPDFIGKIALEEQLRKGLTRHLVGIELIDRGIARHGYEIFANENPIGVVTSGTQSITLNKAIAMGYVATGFEKPGTEIQVKIRNKLVRGKIVPMPFYSRTRNK